MLRKYIQQCFEEMFIDEETSSSEKKDDIKSDNSTWAAAFQVSSKPNAGVMNAQKTDKTMWALKFAGAKNTAKKNAPET